MPAVFIGFSRMRGCRNRPGAKYQKKEQFFHMPSLSYRMNAVNIRYKRSECSLFS